MGNPLAKLAKLYSDSSDVKRFDCEPNRELEIEWLKLSSRFSIWCDRWSSWANHLRPMANLIFAGEIQSMAATCGTDALGRVSDFNFEQYKVGSREFETASAAAWLIKSLSFSSSPALVSFLDDSIESLAQMKLVTLDTFTGDLTVTKRLIESGKCHDNCDVCTAALPVARFRIEDSNPEIKVGQQCEACERAASESIEARTKHAKDEIYALYWMSHDLPEVVRRWVQEECPTSDSKRSERILRAFPPARSSEFAAAVENLIDIAEQHSNTRGAVGNSNPMAQETDDMPWEYCDGGKVKGALLTVKFIEDRYGVSPTKLSRKSSDADRKKMGHAFVYKWSFIKNLADAKFADDLQS